jgi:transposase InsO family protein
MTDVYIFGQLTRALIDSGSGCSLISERYVRTWGIPSVEKERPYPLHTADGTPIKSGRGLVTHEATITLRMQGLEEQLVLDVTDIGDTDIILGMPWLRRINPYIDWINRTLTIQKNRYPVQNLRRQIARKPSSLQGKEPTNVEVVTCYRLEKRSEIAFEIPPEYKEFAILFEEEAPKDALPPHQPWDHEIKLKTGMEPKKFPVFPMGQDKLDALRKYIDEYTAKGFIRESKSPAGYPVFYIPKPDGGLRLCVDYRHLNEITVKNATTLPLIQELRDRLQGAKYFTKFDVPLAFHRIRIKEGDEWKTAFRTRLGHYEYLVMSFGLTNAPATLQAYMNNVLRKYLDIFVTVYMDDILVYSRTMEEHVEHVRKVLTLLKKYNLRLKPSKSEFHKERISFVGCIVTSQGIEVDPEKVAHVKDWPVPGSVKDVQTFHGFANYYRQFIGLFSKIATPITKLMNKTMVFEWTEDAQKAFEILKEKLVTTPVLQLFDSKKPSIVETDASNYAIGAVHSQPGDDGRMRPVAFFSRKLISAETRYSTSDQELLAIVDALKHWRHYLEGSVEKIKVYSDHMNLRNFTTTKELNKRQLRWSEELSSFHFEIIHRKGKENGNADALSRRPDYQDSEKEVINHTLLKEENGVLVHQVAKLQAPTQGMEEIKDAQKKDTTMQNLWNEGKDNPDFKTNNGLHLYKGLVYLPTSLQTAWVESHHTPPLQGHARPEEVLERLRRTYYFPHMRQKVYTQIRKCDLCRRAKYERHQPHGLLQTNKAPTTPWEVVTMDFVGPLPPSQGSDGEVFENIMVVVCRLTKYAIYTPLPRKYDTKYLVKVFTRDVIARHGIPQRIISDRDKLFTSHFWEEVCEMLNITRSLSTAYHPQSDGQTERTNQTMEQYLRLYVDDNQENWSSLLPQAMLAYNATKQETIGMSPFYANFGREPRLDVVSGDLLPTAAVELASGMVDLHQQLQSDLTFLNNRMAYYANKKRIEGPILREGDKVYLWRKNIKTKRPNNKLDFLKLGPYVVKSKKGPVNYELQLPKQMRIHPVFHISLLEKADQQTPTGPGIQLDQEALQPEYEVEAIIDHAVQGRQHKYLIKWKGYPSEENTWEPISNLKNSQQLLQQFHQGRQMRPNQPDPNHRSLQGRKSSRRAPRPAHQG